MSPFTVAALLEQRACQRAAHHQTTTQPFGIYHKMNDPHVFHKTIAHTCSAHVPVTIPGARSPNPAISQEMRFRAQLYERCTRSGAGKAGVAGGSPGASVDGPLETEPVSGPVRCSKRGQVPMGNGSSEPAGRIRKNRMAT